MQERRVSLVSKIMYVTKAQNTWIRRVTKCENQDSVGERDFPVLGFDVDGKGGYTMQLSQSYVYNAMVLKRFF